jgi:quercetin dioxygenase-like cupin family protein
MSETIQLCTDVVIQRGSTPVRREQVMRLEDAVAELPNQLKEEDITSHYFADGVYLREMFMPEGSVVVGKIHRTKHLTIIASGTVQITTDEGVKELTGPSVFVSEPGAKKAIYALTDATLMNPHPTEETDLDRIEDEFIAPSFEALATDHRNRLQEKKV